MDQALTGIQPPPEAQTVPNLLGQRIYRSPLGAPLSRASASFLARDPLTWHLVYWLSIWVVGNLRGEDETLMAFRIEIEHYGILDHEFQLQLLSAWDQYAIANRAPFTLHWMHLTAEGEAAKPFLRDIDRMLINKGLKARTYLYRLEMRLLTKMRLVQIETAKDQFENLIGLYRKLQEEETADAQAQNRLLNLRNGGHH